ncbi:MAG: hypothetical protein AAGI51_14685, partial [Pseudomonadota bacterium]
TAPSPERLSTGRLALLTLAAIVVFMIVNGLLYAGGMYVIRFGDAVRLPNGMEARRQFDWNHRERWDLYSVDGRRRLVKGIDFVCFNDRYVEASASGCGGLFDSEIDGRVEGLTPREEARISGLGGGRFRSCNGYYTSVVGPGLLLPTGRKHMRPGCDRRNPEGPLRRNREWLDKPCNNRPFP